MFLNLLSLATPIITDGWQHATSPGFQGSIQVEVLPVQPLRSLQPRLNELLKALADERSVRQDRQLYPHPVRARPPVPGAAVDELYLSERSESLVQSSLVVEPRGQPLGVGFMSVSLESMLMDGEMLTNEYNVNGCVNYMQ